MVYGEQNLRTGWMIGSNYTVIYTDTIHVAYMSFPMRGEKHFNRTSLLKWLLNLHSGLS